MSQGDRFHQFGYNHYLKAPKREGAGETISDGMSVKAKLARKMQSPAVATVALIAAGVLFAGVIIATLPFSGEDKAPIPIVQADVSPIKATPVDRGGMSIPNSESTLMANIGETKRPVLPRNIGKPGAENLLSSQPQDLTSKEQAIEQAMAKAPEGYEMLIPQQEVVDVMAQESAAQAQAEDAAPPQIIEPSAGVIVEEKPATEEVEFKPDFEIQKPAPEDILQKVGDTQKVEQPVENDEFQARLAQAVSTTKPQAPQRVAQAEMPQAAPAPQSAPQKVQTPGSIDYVVNQVLEKPSAAAAKTVADIEPAAGMATAPKAVAAGTYFVQLASISDPARAGSEWAKMQAKYNSLAGINFRVQEAKLASGTFYRIQAGPMSKADADRVCGALKAQSKPGGCLVVK